MNLDAMDELTELVRSTASDVKTFRARFEDRLEDVEVQMRRLEHERHLPVSGYQPSDEEPTASLPRSPRDLSPDDVRAGTWLHGQILAAVSGASGSGGAFTPPQYAGYFFDLLAARSVALRSGIRVLRTEADSLVVPRLLADQTAAWTAEGDTISESDPDADTLTATPRKLAALTAISNEVIEDSTPPVLESFGQQIIRSLALGFDLGVYQGSGTPPQIRGLRATSGIQAVSMGDAAGGAFADLDPFAEAIGMLETENAEATAIVMHPRSWQDLLQLKELTSGSNKPLLQESAGSGSQGIVRQIYGVPVYLSSQLATNETKGSANNASSAYIYEADQIVAVIRRETTVVVDSSRLFNSDQSEMRAIMRADVIVPNPKAVVRISGIVPAT